MRGVSKSSSRRLSFEGSRWVFPAQLTFVEAVQSHYSNPSVYPINSRGLLFTYIFFTPDSLGEGQFYLMVIGDENGTAFDGRKNYRLNVPPKAPVRQYWSATLYDRSTHALIRDMAHAGRSSQSPGLQMNADGSVDLYFGPTAPTGKETNWTPTSPEGRFEVLFRFYGPEKPLFEKTWVLPDIVEIP